MRIHRIALRNFRGVADAQVSLATDGVTVIEGPNEVGKSSLAEAIDLILEQPDSSAKAAVKAVKPVHRDEGAEVELELTTGAYHVVYAKRWHKLSYTTLRVLAPSPENYTGRQAHDRMKEILAQTLDESLWRALRYQQGTAISQAALGESHSLSSALDTAASGTALGGSDEANLWEQAQAERLRYFTPGGRPTAELAHLDNQVGDYRERADQLRGELERLDAAAERHLRLTTELGQVGKQLDDQRRVVRAHNEAWEQVAAEQRQVADLAKSEQIATAQATAAQATAAERSRLIEYARKAAASLRELEVAAKSESPGLAAARAAHTTALGLRDAARKDHRNSEAANRVAAADFEYFRELLELERLVERHDRALRAEAKLNEATAFLESCPIDEDKLTEIENANEAALQTQARLTGESPSVRIEALRNFELTVNGEHCSMYGGKVVEQCSNQGSLELTLDDMARITIAAGTATRQLADAAAEAQRQLADLYSRVGVIGDNPIVQARRLQQQRLSAQRDEEQARQTLQNDLRDLTPQIIAEKIDRAKVGTTKYQPERSCETPLPTGLDEAQIRSQQAATSLDQARQLAEQQEEKLAGPAAALEVARTADAERNVRIELADQNRLSAEDDLAAARANSSDDDLARHSDELAKTAAASLATHQSAANELAARDPAGARLLRDNAREVLTRMDSDSRHLESELTRVTTELEIKGEQGLQDQLDSVESRLVHLNRKKAQLDRQAAAAQLLYEQLAAHRDAAKRSYVRPFREQVEKLGKIVFGPSLAVELDHKNLQITSRTLDGVTIPYESLSTGAKEQLCVISRLACAALVNPRPSGSPDIGAPVIIDDAFGYSDTSRLERLGAVLALAGRQSQVIVLTCTPERYRNVGSAKVVRLDAETPTRELAGDKKSAEASS